VGRLAELGVIFMAAAVGFLVLRPFRMRFALELNGSEKIFSFNLITFWILFISGVVLLMLHLAENVSHG
jgi:hypothetical protein